MAVSRSFRMRPRKEITWTALDSGNDIEIAGATPDVEYCYEVAAAVAAKTALSDLAVTGPGYRLNTSAPSTKKYMKTRDGATAQVYAYATPQPIMSPTETYPARAVDTSTVSRSHAGAIVAFSPMLTHTIGTDDANMVVEIGGVMDYLEGLTGARPTTMSYPEHTHDRNLMQECRRQGITCCRDGIAQDTDGSPQWGFMQGNYALSAPWETWDKWQPWEVVVVHATSDPGAAGKPLNEKLLSETTSQATANGLSMHELLYETTTNWIGTASTPPLAYASWMALFKAKSSWANVFGHLNPAGDDVSATQLGWLIAELQADSEVWLASLGEIAAYAYGYHEAASDELYWTPTSGNLASELSGAPWGIGVAGTHAVAGAKCAFTFSTDDGRSANVGAWAAFASAGVKMTAFIIQDNVDTAGYVTEAQITAGQAAGGVEFGLHSRTHSDDEVRPLLQRQAFGFYNSGDSGANLAVSVESNALKFHKDAAADFDIRDLPYMEFAMEPWRWSGLSDNDRVTNFTCYYTGVASGDSAGNARPVYKTAQLDGYPAVEFSDAENRGFNMGNTLNPWDATRGMTIYVAMATPDGDNDRVLAKWISPGTATRSFDFRNGIFKASFDGTDEDNSYPFNFTWHDVAGTGWGLGAVTFDPGALVKGYFGTTFRRQDSAETIFDSAANLYIGNGHSGTEGGFNGLMAGMWVFSDAHTGTDLTNCQGWIMNKFTSLPSS